MTPNPIKVGQRFEWRRTFTEDEILRFAELSQDKGIHHIQKDPEGRLMAHGLLTATLPTKAGGDLNFIARMMQFEFKLAAYAGDALTCVGVVDSVITQSQRYKVKFSFTVTNQRGETVLTGTSSG